LATRSIHCPLLCQASPEDSQPTPRRRHRWRRIQDVPEIGRELGAAIAADRRTGYRPSVVTGCRL
jgi:hypothetical protein